MIAFLSCVPFSYAVGEGDIYNLPVPNPYLSYLPISVKPDYKAWQQKISQPQSLEKTVSRKSRATSSFSANQRVELEPNNSYSTAQKISGFGAAAKLENSFSLDARFQVLGGGNIEESVATVEDNGDVVKATEIVFAANTNYKVSSVIGDGAYGRTGLNTGDFDFYKLKGLVSNQVLKIDINAQSLTPASSLDSYLYILNSAHHVVVTNDDFSGIDSFLEFTAPVDGDYYIAVAGFGSPLLTNVADSSSGVSAGSEGNYELIISTGTGVEADYFAIDVLEGDVLEVAVGQSAEKIEVFDSAQSLVMSSKMNIAALLPDRSQVGDLPGNASVVFVAPESGTYYLKADSSSLSVDSDYTLRAQVKRPALEQGVVPQKQILFIDFDGAVINALNLFEYGKGDAELSPLTDFLESWGLTSADENKVIDSILLVITEQLQAQLKKSAGNQKVDLEILNSRDHADIFGAENVSRIIIGGTAQELGMYTIGIAESIDPGNYATQETGVVLLDILSGPEGDSNSINFFKVKDGSSKIDLIGRAVGSIASHEAGHFLSSFHTDNGNDIENIMDQGGNFPQLLGLNDSGQYEHGLKPLVHFVADNYTPNEGFSGKEDTMKSTAYGLLSVPASEPGPPEVTAVAAQSGGSSGGAMSYFVLFLLGFSVFYRKHALTSKLS